jgi:predicted nuclease of restriction endonuclease-like (RecB) superfamily
MSDLLGSDYSQLLSTIKNRIRSAQYVALKAVNTELIALYWDIGKMIVERQQGDSWGKAIVQTLARDLQAEFPGLQGFSTQNLWSMRQFYSEYHRDERLQPLVGEIGWTHHVVIMSKCKDHLEREFYIRMTAKYGWSKNVLIHHIENQTYTKTLTSQTNFDQTVLEEARNQAKLAVRSEYLFDFLDLGDEFSERQLEAAILTRVEPFLKQMGGMFTFIGSQYRLEVEDNEYFVDLLLYHRWLKCLVALELKVDEFKPEYVGKMQFYLAVLDDTVRLPEENPSIGIILCKSQKRTVIEYALRESNKPIGVALYRMVSELPQEYRGKLPAPEQVAALLEDIRLS